MAWFIVACPVSRPRGMATDTVAMIVTVGITIKVADHLFARRTLKATALDCKVTGLLVVGTPYALAGPFVLPFLPRKTRVQASTTNGPSTRAASGPANIRLASRRAS